MSNERILEIAQEIAEEQRRIHGKHQFSQMLREVHMSLSRFLDSLELFPRNYQGPRFETRLTADENGCAVLDVLLIIPVEVVKPMDHIDITLNITDE